MRMALSCVALVLAACAPTGSDVVEGRGETASARGCQAVATSPWRPFSGVEFTVEALSAGPDCERAVATLVIRDAAGRVLWTDARAAAHVMTLSEARDVESMQRAMADWIDPSNQTMPTTAALPDWPANAQAPVSGEFPFYPEPEWERETYLELRRQGTPLFCYVQGMESMACVAVNQGRIDKVGVQSFPG